jgi:signal transduction histidine kinase
MLFVPAMQQDDRFRPEVIELLSSHTFIGFPLVSRGITNGVIELFSSVENTTLFLDMAFFTTFGRLIGTAIDNAILVANTKEREREALALFQLGTTISASLELPDVLDAVAGAACELLEADIGLVGITKENGQEVEIKASAGHEADRLQGMRIPISKETSGNSLLVGNPIMGNIGENNQCCFHDAATIDADQITSYLVVPLQRGEQFLGIIEVMSRKPRRFSQHEAYLLMQLATHVVVAIENAHLYQQLRYVAALEEQNRLARELHDHLAQALGYLKVKASMTGDLLQQSKINLAQDSLHDLKKVTDIVYTDLREAIFNLRTSSAARSDFLPALQTYLDEYRLHYDVDVRLTIDDETTIDFSPEVANQLMRIIQEALVNVRKHAKANRAWVRCKQDGPFITISIEDDGQGFDQKELCNNIRQCYGLQIMQERVESIDGSLQINSEPGLGTRVEVKVHSVYI